MAFPRFAALAAFVLASSALFVSFPTGSAAAPCLPAPTDHARAPIPFLPGLPAGWTPSLSLDHDRVPPVPTVVAQAAGRSCDLTNGLAEFVRAAGVSEPLARATLRAATAHPDVLGLPQPTAASLDGGAVSLRTWSARDGLVVEWRIDASTLAASFVVAATGVGAPLAEWEGPRAWVGFSDDDVAATRGDLGAAEARVLLCDNPDGTTWRLSYYTEFYASPAEADAYAASYCDAARATYAIESIDWGFPSVDPDQIFDIVMDGCSCIRRQAEVYIRVHPKLEDLAAGIGLEYPSNEAFYRTVIGHEWHHHLQYSLQGLEVGSALTEGGARFAETIFEPEGNHAPGTIHFRTGSGLSGMMRTPNRSLDQRAYDLSLLWGYLYALDGGLPFLRAVYEESEPYGFPENEDLVLPSIINRALERVGAPHASFDEAYADFAVAMLARDFAWGPPGADEPLDWGSLLPNVTREPLALWSGGGATTSNTLADHGMMFLHVGGGAGFTGLFVAADPAVTGRWMSYAAGTWVAAPAAAPTTTVPGPVDDAALAVVRSGFTPVLSTSAPGLFAAAFERGLP